MLEDLVRGQVAALALETREALGSQGLGQPATAGLGFQRDETRRRRINGLAMGKTQSPYAKLNAALVT